MTEDEIARVEGEERQRLIGLYRQTGARAFLAAARLLSGQGRALDLADLMATEDPAKEGRPAEQDYFRVVEMHLMVARAEAGSLAGAAQILARRGPGWSVDSSAARLRRKVRELPDTRQAANVMMAAQQEYASSLRRIEAARQQLAEDEQN